MWWIFVNLRYVRKITYQRISTTEITIHYILKYDSANAFIVNVTPQL